jgi:hypothetical protein
MIGLLAAVVLGGVFGSASATVQSLDDTVMVVEISVEVMDTGGTVVAHLHFDNDEPLTIPLLDRDDGTFGTTIDLEPKNYVVVFELVGEETSAPVTLNELGTDLTSESGPTTTTEEGAMTEETQRLLWLAVALAAGSLAVLAIWVLGGRDDQEASGSEVEAGEEEA